MYIGLCRLCLIAIGKIKKLFSYLIIWQEHICCFSKKAGLLCHIYACALFSTGKNISTYFGVQSSFLRHQGGARTPHPGPSQVLHLILLTTTLVFSLKICLMFSCFSVGIIRVMDISFLFSFYIRHRKASDLNSKSENWKCWLALLVLLVDPYSSRITMLQRWLVCKTSGAFQLMCKV